ncbi:MAG TPA: hypothetical protein VMD75_08135 [Candidatus Binataceae bacterium]|nr:hypothetical protein [Candidatus Binataceae bacterium]
MLAAVRDQLLAYLDVMGPQVSLVLLTIALFFIYLAFRHDYARGWFAFYGFTALVFLVFAVFFDAAPQASINYTLVLLGFR